MELNAKIHLNDDDYEAFKARRNPKGYFYIVSTEELVYELVYRAQNSDKVNDLQTELSLIC